MELVLTVLKADCLGGQMTSFSLQLKARLYVMAEAVTEWRQNGSVRISTISSSPRAFTLGDEHVAEVVRGQCKVKFHIHCLNGLTGEGIVLNTFCALLLCLLQREVPIFDDKYQFK